MASKKQIAVIGLGIFGYNIAKVLSQKKCEVLAIDINEERIREISGLITHAVQANATEEKTLRALGIEKMDVVIVGIGTGMEASILVTLLLKEMGVKKIVAKALNSLHGKILRKVGADRIIFPERDMALKLAEGLISPNILDQIELSSYYSIVEIHAPQSFIGKTIRDIDIRAKYGVTVIAIKKKQPIVTKSGETDFKEIVNISPQPEDEIGEGDSLVVLGKIETITQLKKD